MEQDIKIDKSSVVDKNCKLEGNVTIGKNCNITNSTIKDSVIKDNVTIVDSNICGAEIQNNVKIGPYARIRPYTYLDENVTVGNFVEIKNAKIGKRSKLPHLSYVGDAEIGSDVNVGCGVIFCNYDGKNKFKSIVGDRVFIGSNSNIIAPVIIEDESFIAAGTTVTNDVYKGELCIGRVKNETKKGFCNLYLENFKEPLKYFGTDGIRGVYGEDINDALFNKVGTALTKICKNPKVLIGIDTRESSKNIMQSLTNGITFGGGKVYFVDVISTAGVAYLTKFFNFNFGIMVTASHNPSKYNGVKIFDKNGYKINENIERQIEENLQELNSGTIVQPIIVKNDAYLEHLYSVCNHDLTGLNIMLDCANGAVSSYAYNVFKKLNANVTTINTSGEINKDAGILDEDLFISNMKNSNADIGFCFDGDADRVMCITKNLKVLNGDKLLYIISKYKKEHVVVGTVMTNMSIENSLKQNNIKLLRTNVGDKNIAKLIKSKKYKVGAENSGHIILSDYATTGDGVLSALYLLNIFIENKELFLEAENLQTYFTVNDYVETKNKNILKTENVKTEILKQEKFLMSNGRVIVRASGTEPKIRITVEAKEENLAKTAIKSLKEMFIKEIDNGKF